MAPTLSPVHCLWLVLPLMAGCAGVPARVESYAPPVPARGIVIVVDGAGGYPTASRSITAAVEQARLPLCVRTFEWSFGRLRPLADVRDSEHSRCRGDELAGEVNRYRASYPGVGVSLIGFSAGSVVVLAAAERLPANALERIVLLAPAVSTEYNLRRALLSARGGMDVFTSQPRSLVARPGNRRRGDSGRHTRPGRRTGRVPAAGAVPERNRAGGPAAATSVGAGSGLDRQRGRARRQPRAGVSQGVCLAAAHTLSVASASMTLCRPEEAAMRKKTNRNLTLEQSIDTTRP